MSKKVTIVLGILINLVTAMAFYKAGGTYVAKIVDGIGELAEKETPDENETEDTNDEEILEDKKVAA